MYLGRDRVSAQFSLLRLISFPSPSSAPPFPPSLSFFHIHLPSPTFFTASFKYNRKDFVAFHAPSQASVVLNLETIQTNTTGTASTVCLPSWPYLASEILFPPSRGRTDNAPSISVLLAPTQGAEFFRQLPRLSSQLR